MFAMRTLCVEVPSDKVDVLDGAAIPEEETELSCEGWKRVRDHGWTKLQLRKDWEVYNPGFTASVARYWKRHRFH